MVDAREKPPGPFSLTLQRGMNLAKIFKSQEVFGSNATWRKRSCGATPANSRASSIEHMGIIKLPTMQQFPNAQDADH
jgi:hypothetical protein